LSQPNDSSTLISACSNSKLEDLSKTQLDLLCATSLCEVEAVECSLWWPIAVSRCPPRDIFVPLSKITLHVSRHQLNTCFGRRAFVIAGPLRGTVFRTLVAIRKLLKLLSGAC